MNRLALPLVLALASAASAGLPDPGPNRGATRVEIDGTRVAAEARAVAKGHTVDAIVVLGLAPRKKDAPPAIRVYEGWTLDGKTRRSRGDRALGARWRKLVTKILKEVEDPAARRKADPRDLLGRLERAIGMKGTHAVGEEVVGWALGSSQSSAGGRPSIARTAVITIRPRPPGDGTPTPRLRRPEGTTTPSTGGRMRMPRIPAGRGGPGAVGASSSGIADSREGARQHSRIEVDLGEAPVPAPEGTPTPGRKGK